jgi:hypothetical protein
MTHTSGGERGLANPSCWRFTVGVVIGVVCRGLALGCARHTTAIKSATGVEAVLVGAFDRPLT